MHRLFLLAFLFPLVSVLGCAQSQSLPHAQWVSQLGGIDAPTSSASLTRADRALTALARLQSNLSLAPGCHLRTNILRNPTCLAYSYTDGNIYLTSALVDHLNDDELAAVIAHELGHLLHDNVVHAPAALHGTPADNMNIEFAADALGCRLLASHHIPTTALASALRKTAPSTPIYPSLNSRLNHLHTLEQSSPN